MDSVLTDEIEKIGEIKLDGSCKALKPCRRCGCDMADMYPPVGGQPGNKLICQGCRTFCSWLSPNHPKAIIAPPPTPWSPSDDDVLDRGDLFE